MFRVLLAVAMIVQVAACPYRCAAGVKTSIVSEQTCACCPAKDGSNESTPCEHDDESCMACFCAQAADTAVSSSATLFLDFFAVWTDAVCCACSHGEPGRTVDGAFSLPGDGSGKSVRLAVQSLLL